MNVVGYRAPHVVETRCCDLEFFLVREHVQRSHVVPFCVHRRENILSFAWLQVIHMTAASIGSQVYLQNYGACPRHRTLFEKPVHQDLHGVRSGTHEMRSSTCASFSFLSCPLSRRVTLHVTRTLS